MAIRLNKPTEHTEQAAVIEWKLTMMGRYPELELLHAIPNGAKLSYARNSKGERYSREAGKLIDEGLVRGVPDLSLPVGRGGYFGLYIEMKIKGNKTSPEQEYFIELLRAQNYCVRVCYGADEAIREFLDYLHHLPTTEYLTHRV